MEIIKLLLKLEACFPPTHRVHLSHLSLLLCSLLHGGQAQLPALTMESECSCLLFGSSMLALNTTVFDTNRADSSHDFILADKGFLYASCKCQFVINTQSLLSW